MEETIKYYIYLLSLFNELPPDLKEFIKDITADDIKVYKSDYNSFLCKESSNSARLFMLDGLYKKALDKYNAIINNGFKLTLEDKIAYDIILDIRAYARLLKTNTNFLYRNGAYKEARDLMYKESLNHKLSKYDESILHMLDLLIKIKEKGLMPRIYKSNTEDLFESIKNNDFKKALELVDKGRIDKTDLFYSLLLYLSDIPKEEKKQEIDEDPNEWIEMIKNNINQLGVSLLDNLNKEKAITFVNYNLENKDIYLVYREGIYFVTRKNNITNMDMRRSYEDGESLFNQGKYLESIKKFLHIVSYKNVSPIVFKRLGEIYLKLDNKKAAIMYFKIFVSISNNDEIEYKKLIDRLEHPVSETKKENKEKLQLRIVTYLMETGMDILEASKHAKLSFEEIQLLYLKFASEYYRLKDIRMGDFYLKAVEASQNKTDLVKKKLNQVRADKTLLLNKQESNTESFVSNLRRIKPSMIN